MTVKICHMTSAHDSTDIRIFRKECKSLAKRENYDVYLIAPGDSRDESSVKVIGVGDKPKSRLKRMLNFTRKVYKKAICVDADIYHIHDPELLRYALKLKKRSKIVIFDAHEDTVLDIARKEYISPIFRGIIAKIFKKYLTYISRRIDAIVTVTPNLVEKYKKHNKKVVLVTNFPIITEPNKIYDRIQDNIKCKLFFAGGISSMWSHHIIIDAIENTDYVEYLLYGNADQEYLNSLMKKRGWKHVKYGGKVPFEIVDNKMWGADIGLAIMQYIWGEDKNGTMGNTKLFELMLHGVPVIATNFLLWKDIIEANECGICVDPNSIEEIKSAIKYLYNNPDIAKKMGENGRRLVLEKYNWDSQEINLLNLYESLIR